GAALRPDGTTSTLILGPALDGTHGNIAVPATAEGRLLDGDPAWDHAVGPMQFIPSTWSHWGVSATGGVPNPSNIDDAALTAAHLLGGGGWVPRAGGGGAGGGPPKHRPSRERDKGKTPPKPDRRKRLPKGTAGRGGPIHPPP